MIKTASVLALALVLCAASARQSAAQGDAPRPPAQATGDPVRGRALFTEYACYYCHGTEGQGSSPAIGPRIATLPRSQESFIRYVRRPAGRMSAYSEPAIADAALADIYAFLRSIPAPAKAASVPLLEQLRRK